MTTVSVAQPSGRTLPAPASVVRSLWPLMAILCIQSLISVTTLHNTAFQDEGLYVYAGRQLFHHLTGGPAPFDHYAYYFSGYPYVYPLIGGILDTIGGLALARAFSLACMLGVTTIVYLTTTTLFRRPVALFAAGMYASTGVVLFVGRLATFDALCLFFTALATGLSVHTATRRQPWLALSVGPVLVLAILAKYAALLFVLPVFGLLVSVTLGSLGWRAAAVRVVMAVTTFFLSLGVAYELIDKAAFHAIAGTTTNRQTGLMAPRIALCLHVLQMGSVIYVPALVGLLLLFLHRGRFRLAAVVLFVSSLLAPAYHVYKQEPISLDKHMAYALFFAAPLAGYALAWLSGYVPRHRFSSRRPYWLAGLAAVLAATTLGLHQARALYSNWANTSGLSYALRTQLRTYGAARILAEDIEVARYDARDLTKEWQWTSFYYPFYIDHHHHHLLGQPALIAAIKDHYYDFVELSFNYFPAQAYFVAQQMAETRNYDLIGATQLVNSYGRGHFFLWRSALVPGHGDFTSVAQVQTKAWFKCLKPVCLVP